MLRALDEPCIEGEWVLRRMNWISRWNPAKGIGVTIKQFPTIVEYLLRVGRVFRVANLMEYL